MIKKVKVKLIPRWCLLRDTLRGWIVLHHKIQEEVGCRHLGYIKIRCEETNRTIYCRVFGPGKGFSKNNPYIEYYRKAYPEAKEDEYLEEREKKENRVKESLYLDAYYQQKLNLLEKIRDTQYKKEDEKNKVTFVICVPQCSLIKCYYLFRAYLSHPEGGIRVSIWLGLLSISLGLISINIKLFLFFLVILIMCWIVDRCC